MPPRLFPGLGTIICLLIHFAFANTCTSASLQVPPSSRDGEGFTNLPPLSHIRLRTVIKETLILAQLEKYLPRTLPLDDIDSYGLHLTDILASRNDVGIDCHQGVMKITAKISVQCNLKLGIIPHTSKVSLDMVAGIRSAPTFDTNWVVHLNATPICEVDNITIGWLGSSAVSQLRELLASKLRTQLLDSYLSTLEDTVAQSTLIKDAVEEASKEAADGIRVTETPPLWLQLEPVSFRQPILSTENDAIVCVVGVDAIVTAILAKPRLRIWEGMGPLLTDTASEGLFINGQVTTSLDEWDKTNRSQVVGIEIALEEGKALKIEDCHLEVRNTNVLVTLAFTTSGASPKKGELLLMGDPAYDSEKHELYFQNLVFDQRTESRFAKDASWLLNDIIRKRIEKMVRFNISEEMSKYDPLKQSGLQSYKLLKDNTFQAETPKMDVQQVQIQERRLIIPFVIKGRGSIVVKDVDLEKLGGAF